MTDYIIGAGQTASIVKMFFPEAIIIANGQGQAPPLCELWNTKWTRKFVEEFGLENKKRVMTHNYVCSGNLKKAIKQYNKLTHKPLDNKPSMGRKKILILETKIPKTRIGIREKVNDFAGKKLFGEKNTYPAEKIFCCAPFEKQKIFPIQVIEFFSMDKIFKSNYIYLFDKKYLDEGVYRISKKKDCESKGFFYRVEIAGQERINFVGIYEMLCKDGFFDSFIINAWTLKNGHIGKGKKPVDKNGVFFFGRFAQNDNEILLSDVIEKCYRIREELE